MLNERNMGNPGFYLSDRAKFKASLCVGFYKGVRSLSKVFDHFVQLRYWLFYYFKSI